MSVADEMSWIETNIRTGERLDLAISKLENNEFRCKVITDTRWDDESIKKTIRCAKKMRGNIPYSVVDISVILGIGANGLVVQLGKNMHTTGL